MCCNQVPAKLIYVVGGLSTNNDDHIYIKGEFLFIKKDAANPHCKVKSQTITYMSLLQKPGIKTQL